MPGSPPERVVPRPAASSHSNTHPQGPAVPVGKWLRYQCGPVARLGRGPQGAVRGLWGCCACLPGVKEPGGWGGEVSPWDPQGISEDREGEAQGGQGEHPRRLEGSREGAAGAGCRLGWGCGLLLPAPNEHHDVILHKPCKGSARGSCRFFVGFVYLFFFLLFFPLWLRSPALNLSNT